MVHVSLSVQRGVISACATTASFAIGLLLLAGGFHAPLAWLPTGIAVALMVRWGRGQAAWIMGGAIAIGLLGPHPTYGLPAGALALVSGPWLLAWWLERGGFRADFSRRADVLRFVAGTPLAMTLSPTLTLWAMQIFGGYDDSLAAPVDHWLEWWMNGTVSVMLIAPPLIAASGSLPHCWLGAGRRALVLVLATLAFCVAILALPRSLHVAWLSPFGVLIAVASAMLMDLTFTGLLSIAMTTAVAMAGETGLHPFTAPVTTGTTRVWAFSMVLAGLALILRALLAERTALDLRLREAETRYRHGLLEAAAREQERIGRDVHDSLGQELTAIGLLARSLERRARAASTELGDDARDIALAAHCAMQSARSIARGLLPTIEGGDDLVRALQALGERIAAAGGMQVTVRALPGLPIPAEPARNLYRIAQEALNNVLKHSQARRVELHLAPWSPQVSTAAGNGVRMTISDDGIGIDATREPDPATTGLGQRTMQYRAAVAGGEMRFESAPGAGTRVICDLPLPDAALAARTAVVAGATDGVDLGAEHLNARRPGALPAAPAVVARAAPGPEHGARELDGDPRAA